MSDLSQIRTAFERLINEEGHRIVSWNDPDPELFMPVPLLNNSVRNIIVVLQSRNSLRFSIEGAAHNTLGNGSDDDPDGVANEIGPQESETKHQSAQRCVANAVDPGSVVQLADLDEERETQ